MKRLIVIGLFFLLIPVLVTAAVKTINNENKTESLIQKTSTTSSDAAALSDKVTLPVPFYWEIPDGVWVAPWSGACEEASIAAVEGYYKKQQRRIVPRVEAKETIKPFFAIENRLFGYNNDTDAKETAQLINDYTSFDAILKDNPTLEEIKTELRAGRPVITHHYGYGLENPRHRFRAGGSSYHVMVLTGYDDKTKEFFVNDSELSDGIDLRYKYDIIMTTLHDFDHKTKKANGPARVLFTKPKILAKTADSGRIYLVRDGQKHHITSPAVFKAHRWSWNMVKVVEKGYLDSLTVGEPINK